jgi:putative transposase
MSWNSTDPMHERFKLLTDYQSGLYSVSELAERYGVARKTVYKWIERFQSEGSTGLSERSRAPKNSPRCTDAALIERIIELRRQHPSWGARKLRVLLQRGAPSMVLPAASTIAAILAKQGLVDPRRRHRRPEPIHRHVPMEASQPNALWCIDYKGEFRLGNGRYCYPLTLTDAFSRFVLACCAFPSTEHAATQRCVERLFNEYGLPEAIRSDNGTPFVSRALGGLSRLNVWWMKLGIIHDRIHPGRPQENGRHERMHRTLKAETTRPPAETMRAQQERFQHWCDEFNSERPHEALDYQTPAMLYHGSVRAYPERLPKPEYPGHCSVRRVSSDGTFGFDAMHIFLSTVLAGESIALEEVDDGIWNVLFFNHLLGKYDQRSRRIL